MTVRILGIETSCDETGVAVVEDGRRLRANIVASQVELHARYGGVVPEVASRQHLLTLLPVVERALDHAGLRPRDLDAVAVTAGPGLAGALLVGVSTAKALAYAWDLPLLGINHLEGHLYAAWIDEREQNAPVPEFPALGLIVSGGHTDLVIMADHGVYRRLGRTLDDAAGEAFDKVARLLGLGFPGGPAIERIAAGVTKPALRLPRAWLRGTNDFSFSGLKTAVLHRTRETPPPDVAHVAASFQEAVVDVLASKAAAAAEREGARSIILAGGVAANGPLRAALRAKAHVPVFVPSPKLCVDNGAMIAACAAYRFDASRRGLDLDVDASWQIA